MNKRMPEVLQVSENPDGVELELALDGDIAYFEGHFPGLPVLAGVVQLHWACEFSRRYFPGLGEVAQVEVLKFQKILRPGVTLSLLLERKESGKVAFAYRLDSEVVSSGRLLWT